MDVNVYIMLMLRALGVGEIGVDELGERVARPAVLVGGNPEQTFVSAPTVRCFGAMGIA